jgi:hypothetical protein
MLEFQNPSGQFEDLSIHPLCPMDTCLNFRILLVSSEDFLIHPLCPMDTHSVGQPITQIPFVDFTNVKPNACLNDTSIERLSSNPGTSNPNAHHGLH